MQVHIPLTADFLGKEDYFTNMVTDLWEKGYVVVESLIQTKDFPLTQRSITDPAILETLVSSSKPVEKSDDLPIVQDIASLQRREKIVAELVEWCGLQGYDASMMEAYDILVFACDS